MLSPARIPSGCAGARPQLSSPSSSPSPVETDVWFDAAEFVELDETWFDALDARHEEPPGSDPEFVPLTQDCRRSIEQLVHYLGEVKERELVSMGLARLLPDASYDLLMMASTLYTAVREKKHIDLALLQMVGQAASLLGSGNVVARLAECIRQALYDYLGDSFGAADPQQQDDAWVPPMVTALAVALVAAKHWLRHEASPQRPWLRIPTSLARLGVRANTYWQQVNHMAWHAYATPVDSTALAAPAFSVETRMAVTLSPAQAHLAAKHPHTSVAAEGGCRPPPDAHLIAFASNATINKHAFLAAAPAGTITGQPFVIAAPLSTPIGVEQQRDGVVQAVHRHAVDGFQQVLGAVRLFDCATEASGHVAQIDHRLICDLRVKTTCHVLAAAPGGNRRLSGSAISPAKPSASGASHMRQAAATWAFLPVALAAELTAPTQTKAAMDALADMAKAYGTPSYNPTTMRARIDRAVVCLQRAPLAPGHYHKGMFDEVVHALSHIDDDRVRRPLAKLLARLATHTEMASLDARTGGAARCDVPYSAIESEHVLTIIRDIRMIGGEDRFGGDPTRLADMVDRVHTQLVGMHLAENQSVLDIPSVESVKALITSASPDGWTPHVQSFLDVMARSEQAGGFHYGIDKIERLQGLADETLRLLATPRRSATHLDLLDPTIPTFIALLAFMRTELDLAKISVPVLNEARDANDVTALCVATKRPIERARHYARDTLQTAVYACPEKNLGATEHIAFEIYGVMDELSRPTRQSVLGLPSASAVGHALADSISLDPPAWHASLIDTLTRFEAVARARPDLEYSALWHAMHLAVSRQLFQPPGDVSADVVDPADRQARVLIALLALINDKLRGHEAQGEGTPGIANANAGVAQLLARANRPDLGQEALGRSVLALLANAHAYVLAGKTATHQGLPDRLRALATSIQGSSRQLSTSDHGATSLAHAQQIVNQWVLKNVLGSVSLLDYILTRVMAERERPTLTMLRSWVSSASVTVHTHHDPARMTAEEATGFSALWDECVTDTLPLLAIAAEDTESLSLYSPTFFHLYSGSKILAQTGSLQNFTASEIAAVGERVLDIKEAEGVAADELTYFALPAQILARHGQATSDDTPAASPAQAVRLYFEQRKALRAAQDMLSKHFAAYSAAYADWHDEAHLAKEIVAACPPAELRATMLRVRPRLSFQMPQLYAYNITRAYARGLVKPCPGAPDISTEFERRTHRVADSFTPIDRALIWSAIAAMPAAELQFLFAEHSKIFTVDFRMSTTRGTQAFAGGHVYDSNFNIGISGADLLAATVDSEERIYALKARRSNETFEYEMIRVDRHVDLYIKVGILDYAGFTDHYRIQDNKVIDREVYKYTIVRGSKPTSRGTNGEDLIIYLLRKHRAALYQGLHDAGHQSRTPLALQLIRAFVPFYSCAEFFSSERKDPTDLLGCFMDIFSFIPVGSQAARLAGRWGSHFIKGTFRGASMPGLHLAASASRKAIAQGALREVGYSGELRTLGMAMLDYVDPGVMMTASGASALLKKVTRALGPKMPALSTKVMQSERTMMSRHTATRSGHQPEQPGDVRPGRLTDEGFPLVNYEKEPARPLSRPYTYGQFPLDRHSGIRPSYVRKGNFNYPVSHEFKKMSVMTTYENEIVGYRTIADDQYVQIYTQPAQGLSKHPSDTLTISSHGGYVYGDLDNFPSISLPADMTIKMLTPHGTDLIDPTTYDLINNPELKAYVAIKGELVETSFIDQSHSLWFLPESYNPHTPDNALGPGGKLMNYRHTQFGETPSGLVGAIIDNRDMGSVLEVPRSDLLVVNDNLVSADQSDPALASVRRVMQLDEQGVLRNANGERYKTIVFAHCRSNSELPRMLVPAYTPLDQELKIRTANRGASSQREVYVTRATRDDQGGPWQLKTSLVALYFHRSMPPAALTPTSASDFPPGSARTPAPGSSPYI